MIFNKTPVKENRAKKLAIYLSLGFLFSISAVYFYWFDKGIFFYQENESLFIFSYEYLQKFMLQPGGLLEYAGNFLKQGYYNYALGTLLVSILLILLSSVFIKINKRLAYDKSFSVLLILLPSCLLLLMQTHYNHCIHHSLGFLLVTLWFWISNVSVEKRLRFLCLALFPVFYYLTGSFALIYMGLYIIYSLIYDKGILRYQLPAFLMAITLLTVMVFKEVLFLQPVDRLLTYPLLFVDLTKIPVFFYLLCAYIIFFPLMVKGFGSFKVNIKSTKLIPLITILTVLSLTVYQLRKQYDHDHAYLMQLEKSIFNQNWDTVIRQYESYPTVNIIGQYYYNLALSEEGKLCDRLFFGCQDSGSKSLILPRDPEHINRSVYFYYAIGLINEAHHLAYESMVIYGYQPENIKLLIKTELINGNYKVAERYINVLKKTLHYRSWALKYEKMLYNPALIKSDAELGEKISLLTKRDFFVRPDDVQNIDLLLLGNPDNKKAFEYKIARLLLEKDFKAVVYQVKKMKDMSYDYIPRHIEEAILVFINLNLELPYLGELSINPETELQFKQYKATFDLSNNGNKSWFDKEMKNAWGNTFWYYLHFK